MECLQEALKATKAGSVQRGKVLFACTAAYAALASVTSCKEARDAFVALLANNRPTLLVSWHPHVEYNLALALHELDRLDEAETAYLLSLNACKGLADDRTEELKLKIQHNLVDVFQELDRHEDAQSLMDYTYSRLPDELYGAQMRNRKASYAIHKGDTASAILWVESGLGHPSCDVKTRSALMLTKARISREMGKPIDAHDLAIEAMRLAAAVSNSRLCSRIARFLNQL